MLLTSQYLEPSLILRDIELGRIINPNCLNFQKRCCIHSPTSVYWFFRALNFPLDQACLGPNVRSPYWRNPGPVLIDTSTSQGLTIFSIRTSRPGKPERVRNARRSHGPWRSSARVHDWWMVMKLWTAQAWSCSRQGLFGIRATAASNGKLSFQ